MYNTTETNRGLVDLGAVEVNPQNLKLAAIIQLLCEEGADCTVISCRNGDMNIHIKVKGSYAYSKNPKELTPNGKKLNPIEVPREDSIGNKIVANARRNTRASTLRYTRAKTPGCVQLIDKEYTYPQVRELVRLRDKKLETPEDIHLRCVASQKVGTSDFTAEKLSNKEILVLLSIAEGDSLKKKIEFIQANYLLGEDGKLPFLTIYSKFNEYYKYVTKAECTKHFFEGELVDLNKSVRYFIDIVKYPQSKEEVE